MSFSSDVKEELTRTVTHEKCCMMAELTGFLITNCVIVKEEGNFILKMSTENAAAIRRVYNAFKAIYGVIPVTNIEKEKTFKDNLYQLKISNKEDLEKIFKNSLINIDVRLQIIIDDKGAIKGSECCRRSFLRGIFMGGGSMADPNSMYHLEVVASNMENATFINGIMNDLDLNAKTIKRKKDFVVYIKGAERISDFLASIGSNRGIIEFEQVRVIKDVKNRVNRLNNFENANLEKTIDTALLQIEDIMLIKKFRKFQKMPQTLKDIATLRLEYRNDTYTELGEKLNPPLSRAGVSHRFKKIKEIADELRSKE